MTDEIAPNPPAPESKPKKAKRPRRTWRQRLKILVLVLLIGACLFRIALNMLLPTVIDKVANLFGLEVGYQRLSLSILGGTAHIWGLEVRPKEGGDSIATCDYITGNIAPLQLLRGRLVAYRAEVDGVALTVERSADGSIPILQKFMAAQSKSAAPVVQTKPTAAVTPMSLDAPLRVDAIRLSHVTATLRDRSVTPVFEAVVRTSVRVSDVGRDSSPAKFEIEVGVDPVLDTLRISGEARTSPTSLKADVQLLLRGLHPKAAAGYLRPLGLKPVADFITVQANASITADTIPNSNDFKATVAVDNVTAVADGQQWASLSTLTLDAKRAGATGLELGTLAISDGFASAKRTADGHLQMAGLELSPVETAATAPPPATQPAPPIAVASGPPFRFTLDVFEFKKLQANLTDEAVRPAAAFVARLDSLTGGYPNAVGGSRIDSASTQPVGFDLRAALPGLIDSVAVTGDVGAFGPKKTVGLTLRTTGIKPDLLKPYFDRLGITSRLQNGSLRTQLQASVQSVTDGIISADASLGGINFADGDTPLFDINSANVTGASYAPSTGAIGVQSVQLSGPALSVTREADGHVTSAGFAFMAPPAAPAQVKVANHAATAATVAPPSSAPATPSTGLSLPRIEISSFTWSGLQLTLQDLAAAPATKMVITDAGVQLSDLLIDLKATTDQKPGTFRAWLNAPGLAQDLSATGTLTPSPGRFAAEAIVNGEGLNGAPLAPYVRGFGIEPKLSAGRLHAKAAVVLTQGTGPLAADFDLTEATYADAATELAGVDRLHVSGLSPTAQRIDVGELLLTRPRIRVAREANGALVAAGVRYSTPAPSTQPASASAAPAPPNLVAKAPDATPRVQVVNAAMASTAPSTQASTTRAVASGRPITPKSMPILAPLPIELGLKKLRIEDGTIDWSDAAAQGGPAVVHFVGGLSLDDLDVSPSAKPATLRAVAAVDGALKNATVTGTVTASPTAPALDLKIAADGLSAGPLTAYLPSTIQSSLRNGRFETHVAASASNHDAGGLVAKVAVAGLRLSDAADLLKIDAFTLAANRIDPAAEVFTIGELTAHGVALDVRQSPAGVLDACGVRLVAAPTPQPSTQPAATQPAATSVAALPPAATPVASLASLVGDARRPLPNVSIQKLDLGVSHLGLSGFTGPDAAPIELKNVRVFAPGPIAVGGRRADADAPIELKITGGIEPIVRSFDVAVALKAMASEPSIAVDVSAGGIRGNGLLAVLPALKEKIDGSKLTDGTFNTHIDATVNYGRRGPRDFDLGRGFTAEFNVKPLEFRAAPDAPVIAGLQAIHGEGIKVEPANGNVTVKTLDVTTPIFRAHRDAAGIHAAGLTVKIGAQEPVENLVPASQPVAAPIAAAPSASPPAVATRPTNEIRLDHFTVSGIDAVIEDRTAEPMTVIPLKSLDVDVRDLSNQLPWSGKSARFSILVTSDKVPLPPRKGITGEASTQPTSGPYTEQRELFAQVTADGKIGFARSGDTVALDGWAKTAVNGFELLGVRGLAKPYGVTIGGGAFDDTNDIRFRPDGNIETKNKIVFTNLSLSEAANGPLQRLLKLPAPIDVAIGAVTDPDGSITLNLPVPIKNSAVTASDVVGPALGAVTNVLITGIVSAPLKAMGGVGDLLGMGEKDAKPEPPVVIAFLPAYDGLDGDAKSSIAQLAQELKDDEVLELQLRHALTDSDVTRTGTRVNPPPEQALALAAQVRQQKADLLLRHDTLAAQARGDLGSAAMARGNASLAALREVSEQIAKAETALDDLYALTGPSAAQQIDRRTRAASLDLARRRLDVIRAALASAGIKNVDARVHATNPQFDPAPDSGGGTITVTLIRKKH